MKCKCDFSPYATVVLSRQYICWSLWSTCVFFCFRFAVVEGTKDLALFCTINPAIRKKHPLNSYLVKYDTKQFSAEKIVSTGCDMLSAMAVR